MNFASSILIRKVHRNKPRKTLRLAFLSLLVAISCSPLFAQSNAGRILGTITDQSGGVIVGATVTVTDTQRGIARNLTTDAEGEYAAPSLLPGAYTVRAEAQGFKTVDRAGILLEVGQNIRIDLSLQPGEQAQTVEVNEQAPLVDTMSATLGGALSNTTINELPLNGRNYENLLSLRPGITSYPGGGNFTQSTNGVHADSNVYLIDGLANDSPWEGQSVINGGAIAGDAQTILPIDAIQEFNTVENPPAEYGWKPGAIVNVGLKSGSNNIHGTAYAFGRSDRFDARDYFDASPLPKAPLNFEQFGATAGGPIKKDKLFWFVGYEDERYSVGSTYLISAPATVSLSGVDPNATSDSLVDACKSIGFSNVNSLSAHVADLQPDCSVGPASLFPRNNGTNPQGPTFLVPALSSESESDNGLGKIDYHINEHNTINGFYFFGQNDGIWNDAAFEVQPYWRSLVHVRSQVGSVNWTWVPNSNWVNEVRGGYTHLYESFLDADHNVSPTTYGINTGITNPLYFGFPVVKIFQFNPGTFHLGAIWPKIEGPGGVYQFADDASYLHGKHTIKFGVGIMRTQNGGVITSNAKGSIGFGSLNDFLTGNVANGQILSGDVTRQIQNWGFAGFVQDDWRIRPTITLNFGLRYELNTVLKESNNLLGNFDPNVGVEQVGKQISSPYNGDHRDLAPRFGIAWDITGKGRTVLRAGAGIMYEQLPEQVFMSLGNVIGLGNVPTGAAIVTGGVTTPGSGTIKVANTSFSGSQLNWTTPNSSVPVFPSGTATDQCGDGTGADPAPCNTIWVDRSLRTPFVSTWTLGIQQALTSSLALDVAYVGTHGSRLVDWNDANQPPIGTGWTPAAVSQCLASSGTGYNNCFADAGREASARPFNSKFPYLQYIDYLSNHGRSNYDGMQVTLTERAYHGLSYVLGYTYSHALDTSSANWGNDTGVPVGPQPSQYASGDFDIRHRFTLSVTYNLPAIKSWGQMLEAWQVNSIVTIQGGTPWGPQDYSNDFTGTGEGANQSIGVPVGQGEHWNFFGNPSDFTSSSTPFPFFAGTSNLNCLAKAQAIDGAATGLAHASLSNWGCYAKGQSLLLPPPYGVFGNAGRNIFRSSPFRNWDLSVVKGFKIREVLTAQFRVEAFNILNHPEFANPFGGPNGYDNNDPSAGFGFGCGCVTTDSAASNPVLGSGANRAIQLGMKLIF